MPLPSVETLLDIGIALSKEKDKNKVFQTILDAAMDITNCDGGTLYVLRDGALHYHIMINKTFGQRSVGLEIQFPPIVLVPENICAKAALEKKPLNVPDVHNNDEFNFMGPKNFEAMTGYRTVSMLTVPMEDEKRGVIGVLQLINAKDEDGNVVPFSKKYEQVVFSLASQAAICLANNNYAEEVTALLDSFVRVMSTAIDARSPYNANHTRSMAGMAEKFTAWLGENGRMAVDDQWRRQLIMSVWLHDIGKLVVPLEIMDKASRLDAKLETVLHRLMAFRMQNEINYLKKKTDEDTYNRLDGEITYIRELVVKADKVGYLQDDLYDEIRRVAARTMEGPNGEEPVLTEGELVCLSIRKGTLTDDERRLMETHVTMTRRMLTEMEFPIEYKSIPVWAAGHHEHINGKGYPDGLSGDAVPKEVRIITILDIYEALTATDRPYKPMMPLEKAWAVLDDMAGYGQIDGEILGWFREWKAGEKLNG
jgi:HD-GYP domain-containing protein (c-di-GMP phosphodiesterase class II)